MNGFEKVASGRDGQGLHVGVLFSTQKQAAARQSLRPPFSEVFSACWFVVVVVVLGVGLTCFLGFLLGDPKALLPGVAVMVATALLQNPVRYSGAE